MLSASLQEEQKSAATESKTVAPKSADPIYVGHMERARENMLLSLRLLEQELGSKNSQFADKYRNLYLSHKSGPSPDPNTACFDDIWNGLKTAFDNIQDGIGSEDEQRLAIKSVINLLIGAGIPFTNGKALTFWSSFFASEEARKFAAANDAATDYMAVSYLKKILIRREELEFTILGDLVEPPDPHIVSPPYPQLYKLFWLAMSELYAESALPNTDIHIFFQDSLVIGNFFWLAELPKLREKNCRLLMHRYDHLNHV